MGRTGSARTACLPALPALPTLPILSSLPNPNLIREVSVERELSVRHRAVDRPVQRLDLGIPGRRAKERLVELGEILEGDRDVELRPRVRREAELAPPDPEALDHAPVLEIAEIAVDRVAELQILRGVLEVAPNLVVVHSSLWSAALQRRQRVRA